MTKEMNLKEYVNCLPKNHRVKADMRDIMRLLKWSIQYISDSADKSDDQGTPCHECEFVDHPERGYCSFHDKFHSIKEIINTYENIK